MAFMVIRYFENIICEDLGPCSIYVCSFYVCKRNAVIACRNLKCLPKWKKLQILPSIQFLDL